MSIEHGDESKKYFAPDEPVSGGISSGQSPEDVSFTRNTEEIKSIVDKETESEVGKSRLVEALNIENLNDDELKAFTRAIEFVGKNKEFFKQRILPEIRSLQSLDGVDWLLVDSNVQAAFYRYLNLEIVVRHPEGDLSDNDANAVCHNNELQRIGWKMFDKTPEGSEERNLADDPSVREPIDKHFKMLEGIGNTKYYDARDVLKNPEMGVEVFKLAQEAYAKIIDHFYKIAPHYVDFQLGVIKEVRAKIEKLCEGGNLKPENITEAQEGSGEMFSYQDTAE